MRVLNFFKSGLFKKTVICEFTRNFAIEGGNFLGESTQFKWHRRQQISFSVPFWKKIEIGMEIDDMYGVKRWLDGKGFVV